MTPLPDLICTYFTLAGNVGPFDPDNASPVSLARRARAAGAAGYRGLGFNSRDIANLPGHLINHIELDDGSLLPRADYLTETVNNRMAPGDGEFPCQDFLAAVAATGYRGLYGVEILSDAYRNMATEEAATLSWQASARLFHTTHLQVESAVGTSGDE